jgi:hypothetical protein
MKSDLKERIEMGRAARQNESIYRRKKVSKILVIGNLLVVVAMLFYARKPSQIRFSTSIIEYNEINYRLSVTNENEIQKILISLALKSKSTVKKSENYLKNVITLVIKHNDRILYDTTLGNDITILGFAPDEVKSFRVLIDESLFKKFAADHPDSISPKRRTYIFGEQQYVTFKIEMKINTPRSIYSEMDFHYYIN